MPLPASFAASGLRAPQKGRFKALLIGTEGGANCGKTEFAWSAPGPAVHLALDSGHRATLENQNPPETRRLWEDDNMVVIPIDAPLNTGTTQAMALASWQQFYGGPWTQALQNVDVRTVILDGDSDSFEWQMLAEFGRTNNVPQIQRTSLNAARRVMIKRAFNSGKIVITTNKLKRKYENQYHADGSPVLGPDGKNAREWDGVSYERQGFNDHEYCYELQLRHLYSHERKEWGTRILMCKVDRSLEGEEVWGADNNLPYILQNAYPHIALSEWGYDA